MTGPEAQQVPVPGLSPAAARTSAPVVLGRPGGPMSGFDDNPYALAHHRGPVGPPPTRKKTYRPALRAAVVVAVLAGAAVAAYQVTHPSAQRSPTSVAMAFYTGLQHGDPAAAAADVEPEQQPAAVAALSSPRVQQFVGTALAHGGLESGTTAPVASETGVVLQVCDASLSCAPTLVVPTIEVAGTWYVDLNSWLQSLRTTPAG